jgi:hypothetical protein
LGFDGVLVWVWGREGRVGRAGMGCGCRVPMEVVVVVVAFGLVRCRMLALISWSKLTGLMRIVHLPLFCLLSHRFFYC